MLSKYSFSLSMVMETPSFPNVRLSDSPPITLQYSNIFYASNAVAFLISNTLSSLYKFRFVCPLKSKSFNPRRKLLMPDAALEDLAIRQLCSFAVRHKASNAFEGAARACSSKLAASTACRCAPFASEFAACIPFSFQL